MKSDIRRRTGSMIAMIDVLLGLHVDLEKLAI
jgi:hypothetical protein